jgi:hypothetical protein
MIIKINDKKYYSNEIRIAEILKQNKVEKSSLFIIGTGKYIKKLNVDTDFSKEVDTDNVKSYPRFYPKFVVDFVKKEKNKRVRKVVYSKNTRLLNRILKEYSKNYK